MFDPRHHRNFYSAPQSVPSLVAAFMEPLATIAVYLLSLVAIVNRARHAPHFQKMSENSL